MQITEDEDDIKEEFERMDPNGDGYITKGKYYIQMEMDLLQNLAKINKWIYYKILPK